MIKVHDYYRGEERWINSDAIIDVSLNRYIEGLGENLWREVLVTEIRTVQGGYWVYSVKESVQEVVNLIEKDK